MQGNTFQVFTPMYEKFYKAPDCFPTEFMPGDSLHGSGDID